MRNLNLFILIFMMITFLCSPIAIAAVNAESPADVKAEKKEPFLWDLLFSGTKTIVPMVSTPIEITLSPYTANPKTKMSANKEKYTTGDRILIQNHLWLEGNYPPYTVDYYVVFFDNLNPQVVYFFDGSGWGLNVMHQVLRMPVGFDRVDTILDLKLPPNHLVGTFTFAAGLAEPGTDTFYTIGVVTIQIY